MPYKSPKQRGYLHAFKPEVAAKFDAHEAKKRHTGSAAAKSLGSGSHVSSNASTHMKSRMKRY
jgi:hypothetical protein